MVEVISKGKLKVVCKVCSSLLCAEFGEAQVLDSYPTTWRIKCPVCFNWVVLSAVEYVKAVIERSEEAKKEPILLCNAKMSRCNPEFTKNEKLYIDGEKFIDEDDELAIEKLIEEDEKKEQANEQR